MPKQHVGRPVAVQIADPRHPPGGVARQSRRAAAGADAPTVHEAEMPAPVRVVAQQHVVAPVGVEVADAGDPPSRVGRQIRLPALGLDPMRAVHGVVLPAAVVVAQQHVVHAVAVQVADPGERPGAVGGQVHRAALVRHVSATVHRVQAPATVAVTQQHVVPPVAVEVADGGRPGRRKFRRGAVVRGRRMEQIVRAMRREHLPNGGGRSARRCPLTRGGR